MILPNPQNARGLIRIRAVDVLEDRIRRLCNPNEAILVLERARDALLVLFEFVERHHSRTETQTNELMTTADRKHRCLSRADKVTKVIENRLLVIIKVTQRSAQHDRIGSKTFRRLSDFG